MTAFPDQKGADDEPKEFDIFTSLRYDTGLFESGANKSLCFKPQHCPLYMAVYHRDRMVEAARHFGFTSNIGLLENGEEFQKQILQAVRTYLTDNDSADVPLRV